MDNSIYNLRKMLDKKEISTKELAINYLDNIDKYDEKLGCYLDIDRDNVLKQAELAQVAINSKDSKVLTGIPIGIKDNICTKNLKTTCGSKMLENFTPNYNAHVIDLMEKQNFIMLGKLNMDEFAMGGTTQTSYFKSTKNPYNLECVPGGSSGGSASAVSANLCVASLGSDTGGSITQPASFCGVVGIKPTYGLISRYGIIPYADSLDQLGIITNNTYDIGLLLSVLSEYDSKDETMSKLSKIDFLEYIDKPINIKGLKIGVIKDLLEDDINQEVKKSVESVLDFYKSNGAIIEEFSMPIIRYCNDIYAGYANSQGVTNLSKYDGTKFGYKFKEISENWDENVAYNRTEAFGDEVKKRILIGMYVLEKGYYNNFSEFRNVVKKQYNEMLSKCDILINPTTNCTAFKINNNFVNNTDNCTVGACLAGLPQLSIPCGYNKDGMPIGVCFIGNYFQEAKLLGIANIFEKTMQKIKPTIYA